MKDYSSKYIKRIMIDVLKHEKTCVKHPLAVILKCQDGEYITGWNGPSIAGIEHNDCLRKGLPSGVGMEKCPTIHSEIKAISHAAASGHSTKGSTLFMNDWLPCYPCAGAMVSAGISRFVTAENIYENRKNYILIPRLRDSSYRFELSEECMRKAGIEIVIDESLKI